MARFEDLEVWKKSARLSADIYKALAELRDYGFRDQITRSDLEPCTFYPGPPMTTHRAQFQEDTYFRVLRMLQANPDMTQREIAQRLGISASRLNYCFKALINKDWIKVQNFSYSKDKFGYTR